ncbi:MAG: transposase [Verrucomicrobiota bacterium]
MPRQVRIEYEGAIYHCLARGDRREPIVLDDFDRKAFESLLEELVGKTGWKLFAWVLMDNHYHLAIKTPEANLVAGMKWLQNTWTKRFNARHRLWGHVFGGRYKAVLVEDGAYLGSLINYIHLNPARAGLTKVASGVENYPWSSLPDYTGPKRARRSWVSVAEGLEEMRYQDSAADRRKYVGHLEDIALQDRKKAGWIVPEGNDLHSTLRRGWCFGSEAFREKITDQFSHLMNAGRKGRRRKASGFTGEETGGHTEARAEEVVVAGLKALGIKDKELEFLKKGDWRKAMIARSIRSRTTVPMAWIAQRLQMGVTGRVSHAVRLLAEQEAGDRKLRSQGRKLEQFLSKNID